MLNFKKILTLLVAIGLVGCNASQTVVRTTQKQPSKTAHHPQNGKPETAVSNPPTETIVSTSKTVVTSEVIKAYVNKYKDVAMNNMRTYGIPSSIILAQGILESGAGCGTLACTANNHFGIKCHKEWTGESVRHDDDAEQECFRKYVDPAESYKDHALFLTSRSRYANLFALAKDDYKSWARTLRADGYATDPKYPEKLILYIEKYELAQYDAQVLGKEYVPVKKDSPAIVQTAKAPEKNVVDLNETGVYEVQKGDTLYSISKKFNLTVEELKQKNNFTDNSISIGQKLKVM